MTQPPTQPARTPWKLGIVGALTIITALILVFLGIAFLMWNRALINAPTQLANSVQSFAADMVRPKINVKEMVFTSIQDMQKQQKLVVLQTTIDSDVTREEGSTSWGMYWGTNVARVAVKDARVQYYIDLQNLGTSDFIYDGNGTLTLSVPKPRLDGEMISIDPAKIQTLDLRGGWMRWDKQETRENAIAELRPKIIIQGNSPFLQTQAQEAGKDALTRFLAPLMTNLEKERVKLEIVYR